METITKKALAKINLTLDIIDKRPDGYHNLTSVMQTIALHDTLTITKTREPQLALTTNCPGLPADDRNLAYRAAQYFSERYNLNSGININLQKKIPVSAGLGGGSSDCAAVLTGINELFDLRLSEKELMDIGLMFGADVPFCIIGGTALAEGIGEILTPLSPHPPAWIVLARLPAEVSTKDIFERLGEPHSAKKTELMREAINSANVSQIASALGNMLTETAAALHPEINLLINALRKCGALGVNMSGSGPSVFAYFSSEMQAHAAAQDIRLCFHELTDIFITRPA